MMYPLFRCFLLTVTFASAWLCGEVIRLRDGQSVSGTLQTADAREIRIVVAGTERSIPVFDIAEIDFSSSSAAPARKVASASASAAIPVGTEIQVRMVDSIDSQSTREGALFRATLAMDLILDGRVLASRGTEASVVLSSTSQSGKFSGRTELSVRLASVNLNGKAVAISSSEANAISGSQTKNTAVKTGIGAAAGATIGGILGGGRGAGLGAVLGGAAGAGSQVFTKGQRVRIPSETILTFRLTQAVTL